MLKDSLTAYQSRMRDNQKIQVVQERQGLSQRKVHSKGKTKQQQTPFPFKPTDHILCIGEGNFSFTEALCKHPELQYLPPGNIFATAFDTAEICFQKYPESQVNIERLRERGVNILFEVDGTRLERSTALRNKTWDKVVWNFPHAGKGISDQDRNIHANQTLLLGFLRSVAPCLKRGRIPEAHVKRSRAQDRRGSNGNEYEDDEVPAEGAEGGSSSSETRGTVLIALRNGKPYTEWDLPRLAKNPSATHVENPKYSILRSFAFPRAEWESLGYAHRMTKGFVEGTGTGVERAKSSGRDISGEDRCWEFYLSEEST